MVGCCLCVVVCCWLFVACRLLVVTCCLLVGLRITFSVYCVLHVCVVRCVLFVVCDCWCLLVGVCGSYRLFVVVRRLSCVVVFLMCGLRSLCSLMFPRCVLLVECPLVVSISWFIV